MVKNCSKCGVEKDLELFNKDKSSKDGRRSNCKICSAQYRKDNSDKLKEYRESNKEKRVEYDKNRDFSIKRIVSKKYYTSNKEDILSKRKEHYKNNRDSKLNKQKEYQQNNKEKRNIYLVERRKNDPLFRLSTNIRNLINNSFYNMKYSKTSRTQEILGCSFEDLKFYLESKFETWMDWDNRGCYNGEGLFGWDIDHIIPLSEATSEEELIRLNHYTNLQPLCSKMNRDIKKNNIEYAII